MTSFQSTLSGSADDSVSEEAVVDATVPDGVAASELEESLRSISIAEFFEKNKHMLGFDSEARGIVTAVKEGVDNALDATEEAGHLPDIYVEIKETGDYYTLIIEDNGPGITKDQLPNIFGKLLYGSRFHTRAQSRGQQGIGISAAVLYSQLTSGKPARITSRTQGSPSAQYFELLIDTDTNEPEIQTEKTVDWDRPHGTRIELEMEANLRSRSSLHEYIKNTAVVNPHARLTFDDPKLDEPLVFERATDELPDDVEEIKPHPHGVELGTLLKMLAATDSHSLSGFLQEEFTRVGKKTADGIIDNFRDIWYGREMQWDASLYPVETPEDEDVDAPTIAEAVSDAVANKGADATGAFAEGVAEAVMDAGRISYSGLRTIVEEQADAVEDEYGTRFGDTVRENAAEAAWPLIRSVAEADIVATADDVTTTRKNDEAVELLGATVARRLADADKSRATRKELDKFVAAGAERAADRHGESFGDTSQEKIADAIWEQMTTVSDDVPLVREVKDDRDQASALLQGMEQASVMAPPTKCLSPITPEVIEAGLKKEYDADFYAATTRDAEVHGGDPFIIEAGLVYGGEIQSEGSIDIGRFANRVPLVYQRGACSMTGVVKDINWQNYFTGRTGLSQSGGQGMPQGPMLLVIHVASTNVPFTSESKDAVASVPELEHEVEQAIREVARDLKSHLQTQKNLRKRRQKQNVIADILPEMAEKFASVTGSETPDVDDSLAKIMNNVLVDREVDDGSVTLRVRNFSNSNADIELTEMVSAEVDLATDDATVVEMDDEWFVKWDGAVSKGETVTIEYETSDDAEFALDVEDIADEQVTVAE